MVGSVVDVFRNELVILLERNVILSLTFGLVLRRGFLYSVGKRTKLQDHEGRLWTFMFSFIKY